MRRAAYVAVVRFDGFTDRPPGDVDEDLAARVRRCVETHPTLSLRSERVTLRELEIPDTAPEWKQAMEEASAILAEQGLSPT